MLLATHPTVCYTCTVKRAILGCLLVAGLLVGSSQADDSAELLREVLTLVKSGRGDEAWTRLTAIDSFSAQHVPALLQIGQAFQAEGWTAEAADLFARCLELEPGYSAASGRLSALLRTNGLPLWLHSERVRVMPVAVESVAVGNRRLGALVRLRPAASTAQDPRYERRFPHHLWAYSPAKGAGRLRLRFVVHFQREGDAQLAEKCGRILLGLWDLSASRLGLGTRFADDGVVHVWLATWGKPGGEQWQQHIYLYSVDTPRQPLEWVRQLAHEFGHLVIPGIRIESAGEEWANGLIGERLFVKWLHGSGLAGLWAAGTDLTPLAVTAADQLLGDFVASPPAGARGWTLAKLIGFVLYIDSVHGHEVLGDTIRLQNGDTPSDLLKAYKRALLGTEPIVFRWDSASPAVVFVPEDGAYRISAAASQLLLDGRRADGLVTLRAGWHRIASGDGGRVGEIMLVRRHPPTASRTGGSRRG